MRYAPALLDEIRARIPTSQIVGRSVKLKKAGRTFKGLCPFHAEKTPSFTVDDQRGTFHCFGCGKHGDIFSFLVEKHSKTFPEAVEALARDAGVPLPKSSPEATKREARKLTLIEIMGEAAAFYRSALSKSDEARAYLASRKIDRRIIDRFGLGFAPPDRSALKQHLAGKGVEQADMIEAGLLVAGEDIALPFDRFRNRVMIPIADERGRIIAFGGRTLGDAKAKYLNSPATPLFEKGRTLFNAGPAREAALAGGTHVVVEGYTATMTAVAGGYEATCAPMGTAFTDDQARQLWRMSDNPIFAYDGDTAGRSAALRAVDVLLPMLTPGRTASFATLTPGLDPDDFIRQRGPAAFGRVLQSAEPISEMLWRSLCAGRTFGTPDKLAELRAAVDDKLKLIADKDVQREYRDDFADRMRSLRSRPKLVRSNSITHHSTSPSALRLAHGFGAGPAMPLKEAVILAAMIGAPKAVSASIERLTATPHLSGHATVLIGQISAAIVDIDQPGRESVLAALGAIGIRSEVEEAISVCRAAGLMLDDESEAERVLFGRHS